MSWFVVAEIIGIVGQPTVVRLMPGLRPARTCVLALFLLVRRRRLGRSARRLVRMDSEIGVRGKGHPEISSRAPDQRAGNGGG